LGHGVKEPGIGLGTVGEKKEGEVTFTKKKRALYSSIRNQRALRGIVRLLQEPRDTEGKRREGGKFKSRSVGDLRSVK